jgi:hypothetical protein
MRSRLHCVAGALPYEAIRRRERAMNELHFGNQIRRALDEGAQQLDPRTLERLRAARLLALERSRPAPAEVPAFAGSGLGSIDGTRRFSRTLPVALGLLLLGLASLYSAQQKRHAAETVELDSQLLSDELPIDAYLDKGFEAWLKRHRQH